MKHEHEGAGRRGEPTPSQASRPDQIPAPHQRGEGIRGVPPPPGEQAKPQQEGAKGKTILSPGEQKGSDKSGLTPAEEKKIEELIQPEEGEAYDVNQFAKGALRGLKALEIKIDLQEFFNTQHAYGRQILRDQAGKEGNQAFTERELIGLEFLDKRDEAYLKGLVDATRIVKEHIKIKGERPIIDEHEGD